MPDSVGIGIDLGTTNSCIAVVIDGRVQVIPSETGSNTMPSLVSFDDEERLVGEGAKNQMNSNFSNTIYNIKRLTGYESKTHKSHVDVNGLFYKVVDDDGKIFVKVEYRGEVRRYTPEQISSMIVGKLKSRAEAYLGVSVVDAVITVPAYFNTAQRQATRNAGTIAGLNKLKIISEPTAAAIGFGSEKNCRDTTNIFVFDFGGGTFDASILSVQGGNYIVLATGGDSNLGGEDIDQLLVKYCSRAFEKEHGIDISNNIRALRRLKSACEKAKCTLSYVSKAQIDIQSLYGEIDMLLTLKRPTFDETCQGIFNKTITISKEVLKDAKLKPGEIHEVLLVGGSTRILKIQTMIQKLFGKAPNGSIHPDEAVAIGAAKQAVFSNDPKNTNKIQLFDVLPLSIGTGIRGGRTFKHIFKNTRIPTKVVTRFTTREDNQERLRFKVYEGEREFCSDNTLLGSFTIEGLPLAKRGKVSADVTTEVDENGIIKLTAVTTNGLTGGVTIVNNSTFGLSLTEITRMHEEVKLFEEEDHSAKARIDAMYNLEDYIYELRDLAESGTYSKNSSRTLINMFLSSLNWLNDNQNDTFGTYTLFHRNLKNQVSLLT